VNAIRSVHLKNSTGIVLAPGLIAILEDGRFVAQTQFTPMLPDDDQLVPYGYDSTISVSKSTPASLQDNSIKAVDIIESSSTNKHPPVGVSLTHLQTKRTSYVVKNNSTERAINKFYIDHSADVSHGGFVITTKENCIKCVTGFSRFEFSVHPQSELEFVVAEEATYAVNLRTTSQLLNFLKQTAPTLLEQGVVDEKTLDVIRGIIRRDEAIGALQSLELGQFTHHQLSEWILGASVGGQFLKENVIEAAKKVLVSKEKSDDMQRQIDTYKNHIDKVFQNQNRLRENIKSLEKVTNSELMKRYLNDLNLEEEDLIKARKESDLLQECKRKNDKELSDLQFSLTKLAKVAREDIAQD